MPYFFETKKIKLPEGKDRRVKLSEMDKNKIKQFYYQHGLTIRHIARIYKFISRRMIQFILFPERLEKVKNRTREIKRWKKYKKEYRTTAMRKHRRYKYSILKEGEKLWKE